MGLYVHLIVVFACDENEGVAALAKKHLESIDPQKSDEDRDAKQFLLALSQRTGGNPGSRGGVSMWGIIGNYSSGERFSELLRPFWIDLLAGVEGGPHDFEHIIVFEEREQTEQAVAYEIMFDDPEGVGRKLIIKRHELPFCWGQF